VCCADLPYHGVNQGHPEFSQEAMMAIAAMLREAGLIDAAAHEVATRCLARSTVQPQPLRHLARSLLCRRHTPAHAVPARVGQGGRL
jgi:hypothetical protein